MAKIRITQGGCGVYYTDANGTRRHALKTPESGAFECDDAQAARLVGLGVAEYADDQRTPAQEEKPAQSGHLAAEQLEALDYNALKKLAADMGVEPTGKKKADYIAAIVAAEVDIDEEDDSDELPELDAADPE